MTKDASSREFELKFAIDPEAYEALVAHPLLVSAHGMAQALCSTYFDTPDDRLRREHVSVRLRTGDRGTVQTVKQAANSILDRAEWEQPVSGVRPETALLDATPLKPLLDEVGAALVPRFTVEVMRETFPLRRGRSVVEAAFDRGTIRAGEGTLAISELELESKRGRPAAIFDIARDLVRDLPLTLSLESKSERGFAVADRSIDKPVKALALAPPPNATRAGAFETIVQGCLNVLTHNAALIRGADDGEAVHKTRIALRRLRAILALFEPSLRRDRLKALTSDIRWAAARLGEARDADVLQEAYLAPAGRRRPSRAGVEVLSTLMAGRRQRAHARLRTALASSRWRLLLVELLAFSLDGMRRSRRDLGWRGFLRRRLADEHRDLARRARRLSRRSPKRLHEVRKSAKMLRYDLETLAPVSGLGGDEHRVARLRAALEDIQDALGLMQDASAAKAALRAMVDRSRRPSGITREAWRRAADGIVPRSGDARHLTQVAEMAARRIDRRVVFH